MARRLALALLGGGRTRDLHRRAYSGLEGVCVLGSCEPDAEPERERGSRATCGQSARSERRYPDLDSVFTDPEVDAVCVLLPPEQRPDAVLRAARAGKHVSVEAPMARTVAECDAMIAACREAGVTLAVFQSLVFYPPVARARALLQAGAIGEPLCLRARFAAGYGGWKTPIRSWAGRLRPDAPGAGPTILDDGCHELGLALDLLGPVVEVTGWIERTLALVDSPAALAWRHRSGALGYLDAALTPNLYVEGRYVPVDERVQITGSEGTLHLTGGGGRPEEAPPLLLERDGRLEAHCDLDTEWARSFEAAARDFVDAVCSGDAPRLCGARGRAVTAFVHAAVEAGRGGGTVAVAGAEPSEAAS